MRDPAFDRQTRLCHCVVALLQVVLIPQLLLI